MASSAVDFYDGESDYYDGVVYGLSRDVAGIYEKPLHLMLDAIFYYPHPVSDSDSPPQETSGYASTFWSTGAEEHDLTTKQALGGDEERQPPYNGGSNWLSDGSSISRGWGEDFQFCRWRSEDGGYAGGLEKADDSYHGGEEYDSYYKEKDKQPAYDDYSPWSGYGSWFGCGGEEEFYESTQEETKLSHGFSDEFGIYEGIFGYWPCLFQKNYGEQGAYHHEDPWKGAADYHFENSPEW